MSTADIRSALVTAFLEANIFPAENIAFENAAFTPPASAWCSVFHVPGEPSVATLGDGGLDRTDGFLQVDLNFPLNTGDKGASDAFEQIREIFTAGSVFSYSEQEVVLTSCGRSQGRVFNGFWRVSVTAKYYAHLKRSL